MSGLVDRKYFFNLNKICWLIPFLLLAITSSSQDRQFPYKLDKIKDPIIIGTCLGLELTSWIVEPNIPKLNEAELLKLKRIDINSFDRSATYNWSTRVQHYSDISLRSLIFLPATLFIPEIKNRQWSNCLTIGIMYLEASLINISITDLTKVTVRRKRPYLYNTSLSESDRLGFRDNHNSYKSFFSGHTSGAFCAATFLTKTYSDIYGKTTWYYVVASGSFSLAGLTGYYRWKGGVHYPTDIIVGAIVGSSIGYLIPAFHKNNKNKFEAYILPNQFSLYYRW